MKRKLAILGASYLQVPLIEKAKAMGIETHCFAWDNEDAVGKQFSDFFYPISVLEKEQILEKCQEIQIDGITTIATDICIPTISYVAFNLKLVGNSMNSSLMSTNKSKMRASFYLNNINAPKSITISHIDELDGFDFDFPLIVKPTDRSGSLGVNKVTTVDELFLAISNSLDLSIENKVIVEEFIEGNEVSVEAISWNGKHFILVITDKVTTNAPYFVEIEHHQPSQLSLDIQQNIRIATREALKALQIQNGASHSEFKITKEGKIYAIEVGARMGGDFIGSHLVPLSTGYDYIKGVIDIALGTFKEPEVSILNHSGIYFLCEDTKRLQPYFESNESFEIEKKQLKKELKNIKNSNDRSGYLIYQSNQKIIL